MKKLFLTLTITGLISFLFGNYIFSVYKKNLENAIKSVSSTYEKVYMLEYGSYKDKNKALNTNLDNYILETQDGFYKVYVGVTLNSELATKIKSIYKKLGNDIYIREKYISSLEFVDYLNNHEVLSDTSSNDEVLIMEEDIINKYKEYVLNE